MNIRSLNNCFDSFRNIVLENQFSIIGVSETWLQPDFPSKYVCIPNYNLIRADRDGRGGGVACYLKATYKFKIFYSSTSDNTLEQIWLIVNFNKQRVALGTIYRPPSANIVVCLSELSDVLERVYLEANLVLIMGDININLLNANSPDSAKFNSLLYNFNLCQIIKTPTRITANTESLIDVICLSNDVVVRKCDTLDLLNITDHMLVFCELYIENGEVCSDLITYRNYKNFDTNSFAIDATYNVPWENIYELHDINSKVEFLNNSIMSLFDRHAPVYTTTKKRKHHQYITYNIKLMIKSKNKAHKKYLQTRTVTDREYYVTLRNYVNEAIKREKVAYMQFVLNKNKNDQRRVWRNLSDWGIDTKSSSQVNSLPIDLRKPEELNTYFLNVAGQSTINNDLFSFYNNNFVNRDIQFNFEEINNEQILNALKSIKSQAYGVDNINIKMISLVMPYCVEIIKHIFNESLQRGIFPDLWKSANVIPTPKILTPTSFNDLRPICILPTFSKLLEKIISFQIKDYLEMNNILPDIQSGFRQKHGTQTALLKVVNDITTALDKSLPSILVLLDQSKAFDLVNFDLLLSKLKYIGFDNRALNWFSSYITTRTQRVLIEGNICSSVRETSSGVPQGSILGPILFSIFTLDLPTVLLHCQMHLYADDIELYMSVSNIERDIESFNNDLRNIAKYSEDHGLRINPNKTLALCIGPERHSNNITREYKLNIKGSDINWVTSARNLGVIFDNQLSFEEHVNNIFKTSFFKLKSLYKFKYQLSQEVKLKLVKTLIYPHVEYCCSVYYSFLTQQNQLKLQRIQNACMRFVCCIPYREHITPYLLGLNQSNIKNRVHYLITIFLYKLLKTKTPRYLYNLITKRSDIHNVNLRANTFTIPQHSKNKFEGSFSYLAPFFLNKVMSHLDVPINQFKKYVISLSDIN